MSRVVKAFSRPPKAATRRENSPTPSVGVPLNIMCSSMWAIPEVPSTSSIEPTLTHSMLTAVGARGSGFTITVSPLDSVNWCAWGAAAGAVTAGVAGWLWASAAVLVARAASRLRRG